MSSIYLIPANEIDSGVVNQLKAARVGMVKANTVRELILATKDDNTYVVAVSTPVLMSLLTEPEQFFESMPRVLTNVPGVAYFNWLNYASRLPAEDWTTFSDVIKKSGAVDHSLERGMGDRNPLNDKPQRQAFKVEENTLDDARSAADEELDYDEFQ